MTDRREQQLIDAYEKAVDALRKTTKGSQASLRATARVVSAQRALNRYQKNKKG